MPSSKFQERIVELGISVSFEKAGGLEESKLLAGGSESPGGNVGTNPPPN
jgi:hypothetical protein